MGHRTSAHKNRARSIMNRNTTTTTCGQITVEDDQQAPNPPVEPPVEPTPDPSPDPPSDTPDEEGGLGTTALLLGLGAVGAVGYAASQR